MRRRASSGVDPRSVGHRWLRAPTLHRYPARLAAPVFIDRGNHHGQVREDCGRRPLVASHVPRRRRRRIAGDGGGSTRVGRGGRAVGDPLHPAVPAAAAVRRIEPAAGRGAARHRQAGRHHGREGRPRRGSRRTDHQPGAEPEQPQRGPAGRHRRHDLLRSVHRPRHDVRPVVAPRRRDRIRGARPTAAARPSTSTRCTVPDRSPMPCCTTRSTARNSGSRAAGSSRTCRATRTGRPSSPTRATTRT